MKNTVASSALRLVRAPQVSNRASHGQCLTKPSISSRRATFSAPTHFSQLRRSADFRGREVTAIRASSDDDAPSPSLPSPTPDGYVKACVENGSDEEHRAAAAMQGPVVLLRVLDGTELILPVFIGENECQALLSGMKRRPQPRPMTHDLFKNSFEALGFAVSRILVTELKDSTYYARVFFSRRSASGASEERDVDSRPSDAINLAVRFGAPIYIHKAVVATSAYAQPTSSKAAAAAAAAAARPPVQAKRLDAAIDLRVQLAVAVMEKRLDDAAVIARMIAAVAGADAAGAELILAMELAVKEERYGDAAKLRDRLAELNPLLEKEQQERMGPKEEAAPKEKGPGLA